MRGWPKGVRLSEEHKQRIRDGVLRTIPIRRRKRTKEQRRADLELDWTSFGTRRLTPRKKPVKQNEQSGRESVRGRGDHLPPGVYRLGRPALARPYVVDVVERDSSGRPVQFV